MYDVAVAYVDGDVDGYVCVDFGVYGYAYTDSADEYDVDVGVAGMLLVIRMVIVMLVLVLVFF